MRVTPQQIMANTIRAANQHSQRLAELQNAVSSGVRITKPSDAPAEMSDLVAGRSLLGRLEVDLQNVTVVRSTLNQTVAQLVSAKDGFTRAKTLAIDGVQSSETDALALEVNGILDLLVEISNSSDGTSSIFSGIDGARPFDVTGRTSSGEISEVTYSGQVGNSRIVVGRELYVEAFFSGEEVFLNQQRGETYISSNTGAVSGSGTDTFVGNGVLQVRHTGVVVSGASGITASATGAAENSLIGDRQVTVDDTAQTIQLGNGPAVSFDGTETELRLVDEHGATLAVDMTGMTPGFNGTFDVRGDGAFSMDGGATEIPIDFTENQAWEHSDTSTVSYIDTRSIVRAGEDIVETQGTSDAFTALIQLRDELRNERGLDGAEWQAAMQRRIKDLDRVHDHLLRVVGDVSVRLQNLDSIERHAEDSQIEATAKVTEIESTDMIAAIAELQSEQNLLQFTYAASSNLINGTNILDFLR